MFHLKGKLYALQENYVSLWSIGDLGNVDSDGGFEGEHQLLCDIKHHGDVMDLQVSLCNIGKLTFRGAWVAQSVERPTSAQVVISQCVNSSPASGSVLTARNLEPVSDSLSPSL